eukprot:366559-Chlamydomonas_euryale.AAC.16
MTLRLARIKIAIRIPRSCPVFIHLLACVPHTSAGLINCDSKHLSLRLAHAKIASSISPREACVLPDADIDEVGAAAHGRRLCACVRGGGGESRGDRGLVRGDAVEPPTHSHIHPHTTSPTHTLPTPTHTLPTPTHSLPTPAHILRTHPAQPTLHNPTHHAAPRQRNDRLHQPPLALQTPHASLYSTCKLCIGRLLVLSTDSASSLSCKSVHPSVVAEIHSPAVTWLRYRIVPHPHDTVRFRTAPSARCATPISTPLALVSLQVALPSRSSRHACSPSPLMSTLHTVALRRAHPVPVHTPRRPHQVLHRDNITMLEDDGLEEEDIDKPTHFFKKARNSWAWGLDLLICRPAASPGVLQTVTSQGSGVEGLGCRL